MIYNLLSVQSNSKNNIQMSFFHLTNYLIYDIIYSILRVTINFKVKNMYNTQKNREIIEFLKENKDRAFCAEEISRALNSDQKGKSTVYRQLKKLVENGNVKRLADAETRRVTYQYLDKVSCSCHLHLKCVVCGKLIHMSDSISASLKSILLSCENFTLDQSSLLLGKCSDCLNK